MATLRPASDPWCLWLRERLTTLGVTPKAFALQLGISQQAVYWLLKDGGSLPPDSRVPRLAVLLGCSEDEVRRARGAAWKHRGMALGRRLTGCCATSAIHAPKTSGAA
jgi:hypothetical protein